MNPPGSGDAARHAPATERNREPLREVLSTRIAPGATVLEIASGTGEHAAYLAPRLGVAHWLPSDVDPTALASIAAHTHGLEEVDAPFVLDVCHAGRAASWPAISVDAVFCANMIHIAPVAATTGLLRCAAQVLAPRGSLFLYGPFAIGGRHTAPSNAAFDADLRRRNPEWGVRDLAHVTREAAGLGLDSSEVIQMPANNLVVVFVRGR